MSQSPFRAELAKIRSLPRGKRWEYIWEYYRLTFFLAAFGLFFLGAIGTFLVNGLIHTINPKDSFSIAFAAPGYAGSRQWTEGCLEAIGYDEDREEFLVLSSNPHSDLADDFRINASVWLVSGQPDIFIVNEAGYRYLLELEALADLNEVWPEDLRQMAADRMVLPYALDLAGTAFAETFGLTEAPVYLCMYPHGKGFQRALDVVRYILAGG